MKEIITQQLETIEEEENVRVLFAIESGSRSWGFESTDSDWDVRFVYVRRLEDYLRIDPVRDVIDRMLEPDLDFVGWDLRKALQLLRKSNPSIVEWLQANEFYRFDEELMTAMREIMPTYVDPWTGFRHYMSMASANIRANLMGDEVSLKKYLYVLRPVLAAEFIRRYQEWPRMKFETLVSRTLDDQAVLEALEILLKKKRAGVEVGKGPKDPILHEFIESEMTRLNGVNPSRSKITSAGPLNKLFASQANR